MFQTDISFKDSAKTLIPGQAHQCSLVEERIMNIVLNSLVLYVVDYPSVGAVEVIDKRRARGTLLAGDAAVRFRRELADAMGQSEDEDADIDLECLDHFEALMTQPAIYQ